MHFFGHRFSLKWLLLFELSEAHKKISFSALCHAVVKREAGFNTSDFAGCLLT
jgi:hypothetical protein